MKRKSLGIAALLALFSFAPLALAQPQPGPTPERMKAMQERFEREARLMRLVAIADALQLSDAEALQIDKTLSRYDARRRPLQQEIFQGVQILRRAARGDETAYAQVDRTLSQMVQARAQLHAIEFEMFQELAKGRSPQQRARLALAMARLSMQMRNVAKHPHGGHGGNGDDEP